jgi:uncharacterized SAM-binding protein YcdF (DUF218 family)
VNYLLWYLFGPVSWPLWLGVAGALLSTGRRVRAGRGLMLASALLFCTFGFSPLGLLLIRPLETRFPPIPTAAAPTDIVVLAGGEALRASAESGHAEYNDAGDRSAQGAVLARRYPAARIWIAGGIRAPGRPLSDADWTRRQWIALGIEPGRIVAVNGTLDTCGNAAGVAAGRPGARIMLVTSAFHMPRSIACFRAAGLDPLSYPVDYRGWEPRNGADMWSANPLRNFDRIDMALHEWVGLAVYRLQGRIDDIWPAPDQALGRRSQTRSE